MGDDKKEEKKKKRTERNFHFMDKQLDDSLAT